MTTTHLIPKVFMVLYIYEHFQPCDIVKKTRMNRNAIGFDCNDLTKVHAPTHPIRPRKHGGFFFFMVVK